MTTPRRIDPPQHYDDERRAIWDEAVNRLTANGRIFRTDPELLNAYVENIRSLRQASQLLTDTAVLITRQGGGVTENPALRIQRQSAEAIGRLSRQLGLTGPGAADPMGPRPNGNPSEPGLPADPHGGARWCDQHRRFECVHHRNRRACGCPPGAPPRPEGCCHRPVVAGTDACPNHAGMSHEQAVERGRVTIARTFGTQADVTPVAGLLEEIRWSGGHVRALRALVAQIEADGPGVDGALWFGTTRTVTRDGEVEEERRPVPHVILRAYNEERDRFAKLCAAAIAQGAQERAVDAAKASGASLGRLFDAFLAAFLVLPPELAQQAGAAALLEWQRSRVPVVIPEIIREWDPADLEAG